MRRLLLLILVVAAVQVDAISYAAFEQITVAGSSIGLSASKITPTGLPMATLAVCRIRTAQISYTIDGTVPTASVGTLAEVGDVLTFSGHDVLALVRMIRTGSSAQADCTYTAP